MPAHFSTGVDKRRQKMPAHVGRQLGGKRLPPPLTIGRAGRLTQDFLLLALAAVIINHEANPASQKGDHHRNGYQTENYRVVPVHGASSRHMMLCPDSSAGVTGES